MPDDAQRSKRISAGVSWDGKSDGIETSPIKILIRRDSQAREVTTMQITITATPNEIAGLVLALQGRQSADDAARLQEMFDRITDGAKEIHTSDEPMKF